MTSALIASLLVSSTPQARQVTLADGTVHTLHFKELPASVFRGYFNVLRGTDEAAKARALAELIASSLVNEDGTPALTAEQATLLKSPAEAAITEALMEVNGMGAKKADELGNASPTAASSGSGMH